MNKDNIINKYLSEEIDKYRLIGSKSQELISSVLKSNNIRYHSITSRAKGPNSLREKIIRTGKNYDDPLSEITDFAGVRVISYFPTDVDKIVNLIEQEFEIDRANSIDKRKDSDPSVFGYSSVHLVVEFSHDRLKLPEYSLFRGLKCEVQVRTILQHAWAEIEHDIIYKAVDDIPFELRRRFSSLAGLLEVADREFESLRKDELRIRSVIKRTIDKDDINIPINFDSILFYLEKYHNLSTADPEKIHKLIKLLKNTDIMSINDLHNILTKDAIAKAKKSSSELTCCPEKMYLDCLIPFFIVIGKKYNMTMKQIGECADCVELEDMDVQKKGAGSGLQIDI